MQGLVGLSNFFDLWAALWHACEGRSRSGSDLAAPIISLALTLTLTNATYSASDMVAAANGAPVSALCAIIHLVAREGTASWEVVPIANFDAVNP